MSYIKNNIIKKIKNLFVLIAILIPFNLAAFFLINNAPNKYQAKIIFEPSKLNNEYLISQENLMAQLKVSDVLSDDFKFTRLNSYILAEVEAESADKANSAIQNLLDNIENEAKKAYNLRLNDIEKENQLTNDFIDITDKIMVNLDGSTRKKWLNLASKRFYFISTKRTETKIILNQKATIKILYKKPLLIYLLFNIIGLGVFSFKKFISSKLAYLRKKYS